MDEDDPNNGEGGEEEEEEEIQRQMETQMTSGDEEEAQHFRNIGSHDGENAAAGLRANSSHFFFSRVWFPFVALSSEL